MPNNITHQPMVLRKRTVCSLLGISASTLDRLRAHGGDFPLAIRLSDQAIGWLTEEIDAWLASRKPKTTH